MGDCDNIWVIGDDWGWLLGDWGWLLGDWGWLGVIGGG